ncbi:ATP phosphoribosyltransferase [Portibacter lacus]|uniref:ATP phosphoribosyltransferase n=1 Tax=Portibacter lacus TaxID=1099794 RepID=A0AA37SR91_9BACT|nr:ATP phosphoribosyltransferase [Portibacter lacus]GLR16310.1 ATP phosphoribosyltransferase [Portibacter lacus]
MENRLNVAVQKKGRLFDGSLELLKSGGISINNGKDQLKASSHNFPLDVLYLRNSDIPQYVVDGVADIAVVGENLLVEKNADVEVIEKLGFSKCRLSIAIPKESEYNGIEDLNGKRIATSYPVTLQKFLDEKGIDAEIHVISGSVEIAPNIGLSDAICDLVSSGSTLFKNGLVEKEVILKSQAVIVKNKNLSPEKEALIDKVIFRIRTVLRARKSKYILMNAPNDKIEQISNILPVLKSPTVLPLATEGWSSVHSVIEEDKFWEVIEELKEAGAEGILIVPIEKIVM